MKSKPLPNYLDIAAALQEIAVLLRLKGGRYFQARAYESAARVVAQLGDSIDSLIKEDRLRSLASVGEAIDHACRAYKTGYTSQVCLQSETDKENSRAWSNIERFAS